MTRKNLTEEDLERLAELVKPRLTAKRYAHTRAVEREAARLGEIYLPEQIPALRASALLHDITKKEDTEKQLKICAEFGIITDETDRLSPSVFHAMTGAAVASRDFAEFTDGEILSGIRWHTTGRAGMSMFESIVYLADYIEETRTFDDCVKLRRDFWGRNEKGDDPHLVFDEIMVESFDLTLAGLIRDGLPIAADSVAARNDRLLKLHLRQTERNAETGGPDRP